jgi:geranylgeranyl transferase type-2 subunit beta
LDTMSLAAGPGRGRVAGGQFPDDLKLVIDKHVAYVQKLDTVRFLPSTGSNEL